MMQAEFEKIIGSPVKNEEYDAIEFVYMWHPSISDTEGKHQIASIYRLGGMAVINDMTKRAELNKEIQEMMDECSKKMEYLQKKRVELVNCQDVESFEIKRD